MSQLTDLQDQLAEVKAAISKVLTGGQEYEFNDMQSQQKVERADLKDLYAMQRDLEYQIASLDRSGGFYGY